MTADSETSSGSAKRSRFSVLEVHEAVLFTASRVAWFVRGGLLWSSWSGAEGAQRLQEHHLIQLTWRRFHSDCDGRKLSQWSPNWDHATAEVRKLPSVCPSVTIRRSRDGNGKNMFPHKTRCVHVPRTPNNPPNNHKKHRAHRPLDSVTKAAADARILTILDHVICTCSRNWSVLTPVTPNSN